MPSALRDEAAGVVIAYGPLARLAHAPTPFGSARLGRALAVVTGVVLGAGIGLETALGDPAAIVVAAVVLGLVVLLAAALTPARWLSPLVAILIFGFALRVAAAAAIYAASIAAGRGGFVTGDDAGYAILSWGFVQYIRGAGQPPYVPPNWNGDDYLFGPFVYVESAVFFVFGRHPVLMEFLSAGLMVGAAVLLFDVCRRAFSERAGMLAATLMVLYPSLILWSALNLKEAMVVFLVALVIWALLQAELEHRFAYILLAALVLVPMRGLRVNAYLGLAVLIPIAATISARWVKSPTRWVAGAAVAVIAVLVFAGIPGFLADPFTQLDKARRNNAVGARTSFVDPAQVEAHPGDMFVVIAPRDAGGTPAPDVRVTAPSPSPASASMCGAPSSGRTPALVVVSPGTRLILAPTGAPPTPSPPPGAVYVQPGDVVFISGSSATPAPVDNCKPLPLFDLREDRPSAQLSSRQDSDTLVLSHTISHVPVGFVYAFFSPFVWESHGISELAGAVENLLWYPLLVAAIWTAWRRRSGWELYAPTLLAAIGFLGVLVLAEGNVGSLFRHRGMIVPLVIVIAAPTILEVIDRLRGRGSVVRE